MGTLDRRIGFLFGFFLFLLVGAFARTFYFGAVKGSHLSAVAQTQQVSTHVVPARRGTIVDRHGIGLAISDPAADIAADPHFIVNPAATAAKLAPILDMDARDVLPLLIKRDKGFVYLKRGLPAATAARLMKLKLPGISSSPSEARTYPHGMLASQLLGFVGIDHDGLAGIEYAQNKHLMGVDGKRKTVNDAHGEPLAVTDLAKARQGARVELTIDASIQEQTERVLAAVGAKYTPHFATAIVMDPRDNSILALANWPRVDANDWQGAPSYAQRDNAVGFDYEPGSTFKAFTVAGALSEGTITPTTMFNLPPQIQVADRTIGEAEDRGTIDLSTAGILQQSSNVGAIKIGMTLGRNRFDEWVHRFGFGRPTGVDIPGEERGQVIRASQYSGSSMGNLPIGQGLSVTPLQIATAYAAIANGGILRRPHVVQRVGGKVVRTPKGRRIITPQVASELRDMLKGVLAPGGTASEVSVPPYELAGKTGTASKIDPKTGEYSKVDYDSSFVGFAPADHPRLLVAVVVDKPRGGYLGGQVAAPAFGDIARFALPYLRIPPN